MCGRFAMDETVNQLITEFIAETGRPPEEWTPAWESSWNIAPTQDIPVLIESPRPEHDRRLRCERASWSLIPRWSPTLRPAYPTFNARSETAAIKPTFRDSLPRQRALIFANGYYEWHTKDGIKTPYFISRRDAEITAFAGLYSWWADPALPTDSPERWHLTATMLTAETSPHLAELHPRNPVFVPRSAWSEWLDTRTVGNDAMLEHFRALGAAESREYDYHPVAPLRGDGPGLIAPRDES